MESWVEFRGQTLFATYNHLLLFKDSNTQGLNQILDFPNFCFSNSRFSNMPCCFSTNVQAAFVLGIIGVVLNLVSCCFAIVTGEGKIGFGILGALISAILVYGAHARNYIAIQAIQLSLILHSVGEVIFTIIASVKSKRKYSFSCLLNEDKYISWFLVPSCNREMQGSWILGTAFIVKSQSRSKTFQKFSFLALLHNFAINSHDVPYPNLSNLTNHSTWK